MYVCICNAVTDKQIRQAIDDGASTMRDLYKQFGIANNCGKCACMARDLLQEHRQNPPNAYPVLASLSANAGI